MQHTLLITGGSSDIALDYINTYHTHYASIIAHFNQSDTQLKSLNIPNLTTIQADLSSTEEVQKLLEKIKVPTHFLHLAAPKLSILPFKSLSQEEFDLNMKVQVYSAVQLLQSLLPKMVKQTFGKVIMMLSSNVLDIPPKGMTAYTTAKYALLGLTKSLAEEYQNKPIQINAISPGMIDTKYLSNIPDFVIDQARAATPNKKLLSPQDVSQAIHALLQTETTGTNLKI